MRRQSPLRTSQFMICETRRRKILHSPEGDKDEHDRFLMHVPAEHERGETAMSDRTQESLVVWFLPQLRQQCLRN